MIKNILVGILLLGLISPIVSKADTSPTPPPAVTSGNTVEGLSLPPDQTVKNDEGFITIQAKCGGDVKWLVVSGLKIKYFSMPQNTIVVSIPPQGGLVTIFAVGLVNGKLTEFARTNITVTAPATPGPTPQVNPWHVSLIFDSKKLTPELAVILNSQKVMDAVNGKNAYYRRLDVSDDKHMRIMKSTGLSVVLDQEGGPPLLVVQKGDGSIAVKPVKIPTTEAEVLNIINSVLK